MNKKLLAIALFVGVSGVFAQFSIGIQIGPPPQPRVIRVRPNAPDQSYTWVDGYWYPSGRRYAWHNGYWTRPPYQGANWASPRYEQGQYFEGYWAGGDRGEMKHDHRWDKNKRGRDYDHDDRDEGRGRGRGRDR